MMDKPESQETGSKEHEIKDEFDLKKAEYALKVQEFKAQSKVNERNSWFTSPILVVVLSALFGLLGSGIGAALQGYSNTQLERQKFEATLIQKALESTQQEERARNLLFLVDAGLIKSLDSRKIEELARNPARLPV